MQSAAVLFDMDGVIFDSERAIYNLVLELAEEEGVTGIPEVYPQLIGITREKSIKILTDFYGPDFPYARYREILTERYHSRYDHGRLPLKPYVHEILSDLSRLGFRLAVASSTPTPVVVRQIEEAGLARYFSSVIGGDQVRRSKPEPDIFLFAAGSVGAAPEACYVIEDSFNGIRSAAAAGMTPVMVPDMLEPDGKIRSLAAAVLPDLGAADRWIAGDARRRLLIP